jgi:GrpB-like predicted nucleotidyltransferase (UPF0157 family)
MGVVVEPHNPAWAVEFAAIRDELYKTLEEIPNVSIEHVGSTSIPGLVAKPILDIDIIVTPENLDAVRAAMVSAGYTDLGELGVPGRFAMRQPGHWRSQVAGNSTKGNSQTKGVRRHTYVILEGSISLKNHRDLKRMMLEDDGLRDEYGEVKKRLAGQELEDIDEYCKGKNEVLLKILRSAGWSEEELEEVRKANE